MTSLPECLQRYQSSKTHCMDQPSSVSSTTSLLASGAETDISTTSTATSTQEPSKLSRDNILPKCLRHIKFNCILPETRNIIIQLLCDSSSIYEFNTQGGGVPKKQTKRREVARFCMYDSVCMGVKKNSKFCQSHIWKPSNLKAI